MDSRSLARSLGPDGRISSRPPLMSVEENSKALLLVDSSDRVAGTSPFDFSVDLLSSLPRVRYLTLKKITLPQVNNIHSGNNSLRIKSSLGTTNIITLDPGFYNTSTLANELTSKINAQFVVDAIADTVTTVFDPIQRNFSISSVGGNNMFIIGDDSTTLIQYGEHLVPFESEPEANVPSSSVIYSGVAAMLPSRYFLITSSALTKNQYQRSIISSSTRQLGNLIAVVDLCNLYTPQDFDIGVPYTGVYQTVDVDGTRLSLMNSQDGLERLIDFQILDGYKRDVASFYNLQAPAPTTTKLSVVMNFEISY
jgi:hypothetical protein